MRSTLLIQQALLAVAVEQEVVEIQTTYQLGEDWNSEQEHDDIHPDAKEGASNVADQIRKQLNIDGITNANEGMTLISKALNDGDKCKSCVKEATKAIMKDMIGGIEKKCKEAEKCSDEKKCDKMKMFCAWYEAHPKMAIGFVAVKVSPITHGYAWCLGAKYCDEKKEELHQLEFGEDDDLIFDLNAVDEDDELQVENMLEDEGGEQLLMEVADDWHHHHHHHNLLKKAADFVGGLWKKVFGPPQEYSPEEWAEWKQGEVLVEEKTMSLEDSWMFEEQDRLARIAYLRGVKDDHEVQDHFYVPKVKGVCKKCFKKTFGVVMKYAVAGTKKMCMKTKCPVLGRWCKWARNHREMAFGMLLAKVEPWKFALGRCYNADHHHHDDDHKGKGKGGDKGKGKGKGDNKGKGKGKGDDSKGKGKGKGGKGDTAIYDTYSYTEKSFIGADGQQVVEWSKTWTDPKTGKEETKSGSKTVPKDWMTTLFANDGLAEVVKAVGDALDSNEQVVQVDYK